MPSTVSAALAIGTSWNPSVNRRCCLRGGSDARNPFNQGQVGILHRVDRENPAQDRVERHDTVVHGCADVGRCRDGHHGRYIRVRIGGQRPLHVPQIAWSPRDDASVGPRLLSYPCGGGGTVRALVEVRNKRRAIGIEASAHVLAHHAITPLREPAGQRHGQRAAPPPAPIGRPHEDSRTRGHDVFRNRMVDVGSQRQAVLSRHTDVAFHLHAVARRLETERSADHPPAHRRECREGSGAECAQTNQRTRCRARAPDAHIDHCSHQRLGKLNLDNRGWAEAAIRLSMMASRQDFAIAIARRLARWATHKPLSRPSKVPSGFFIRTRSPPVTGRARPTRPPGTGDDSKCLARGDGRATLRRQGTGGRTVQIWGYCAGCDDWFVCVRGHRWSRRKLGLSRVRPASRKYRAVGQRRRGASPTRPFGVLARCSGRAAGRIETGRRLRSPHVERAPHVERV